MHYLPGQYVNVSVPGTTQARSYSFSSMPRDGIVQFLVRNISGGLMSSYLAERAKIGDTVTIAGPIGSFYLRDLTRPVLFLAGGTGLAPFLAMLDELERATPNQPIHMVYGVTNDADLVEVGTLEAYVARIPGFTFTTVVAAADSAHPQKGYVTHHLPETALNGGDVDVYLCGPPPMVDAVRTYLHEKHIVPTSFHYEKFSPSEGHK
jgi:benzoate/toluate 1,2-dioxygenase reductase component